MSHEGVWTHNAEHTSYDLSKQLVTVLTLRFNPSAEWLLKRVLKGFELKMLSTHSKSSFPASQQGDTWLDFLSL